MRDSPVWIFVDAMHWPEGDLMFPVLMRHVYPKRGPLKPTPFSNTTSFVWECRVISGSLWYERLISTSLRGAISSQQGQREHPTAVELAQQGQQERKKRMKCLRNSLSFSKDSKPSIHQEKLGQPGNRKQFEEENQTRQKNQDKITDRKGSMKQKNSSEYRTNPTKQSTKVEIIKMMMMIL